MLRCFESEKRLTVKQAKKTRVLPRDCEADGHSIKGKAGAKKEYTDQLAEQLLDQFMKVVQLHFSFQ